jgi:hypothetical protein
MKKNDLLTKILAVLGTLLIWFPILAPIAFGGARLLRGGRFMLDYLMPAELAGIVLLGGLLLIWAAFRAKSQRGIIGWGFAAAVVCLLLSLGLAQVTGLASGAIEEGGWQWALVLGLLMLYILAVIVVGVGGVKLWKGLFRKEAKD